MRNKSISVPGLVLIEKVPLSRAVIKSSYLTDNDGNNDIDNMESLHDSTSDWMLTPDPGELTTTFNFFYFIWFYFDLFHLSLFISFKFISFFIFLILLSSLYFSEVYRIPILSQLSLFSSFLSTLFLLHSFFTFHFTPFTSYFSLLTFKKKMISSY